MIEKDLLTVALLCTKIFSYFGRRHLGKVLEKFTCQRINVPTIRFVASNKTLGRDENIYIVIIALGFDKDLCLSCIADSPSTQPLELLKTMVLTSWVNNCYWPRKISDHAQRIRIIGSKSLLLFYLVCHNYLPFSKNIIVLFTTCGNYITFFLKMQEMKDFRKTNLFSSIFLRKFLYKINNLG